jgi:hypothetical protein
MPKKKNAESPEQQFERFRKTVPELLDAGEVSPREVNDRFERAMGKIAPRVSSTESD